MCASKVCIYVFGIIISYSLRRRAIDPSLYYRIDAEVVRHLLSPSVSESWNPTLLDAVRCDAERDDMMMLSLSMQSDAPSSQNLGRVR